MKHPHQQCRPVRCGQGKSNITMIFFTAEEKLMDVYIVDLNWIRDWNGNRKARLNDGANTRREN